MTTMPFAALQLSSREFTNPRTRSGLTTEHIRELASHIGFHGLLTPLLVTRDGVVIGGQRRYRAIKMLIDYLATGAPTEGGPLPNGDFIEATMRRFERDGIPVNVIDTGSLIADEGLAIADNLMREDLSSYEVAARLAQMHEQGATGAELSRLIGKSPTYVSRKLGAWKGAGPELRAIWERGELAEDVVQGIANMPLAKQTKLLARGVVPKRGPANRPAIDTVKDVLLGLEEKPVPPGAQVAIGAEARSISYAAGVLDALRWVTGRQSSEEFSKLVADTES